MAKKNKNNNKSIWIGVALMVGGVVVYLASSYGGLLGARTYSEGEQAIATQLECNWSANNTLEARLTVADSASNSIALPLGSPLQAQVITWNVDAEGTLKTETSITDEQGVARTEYVQASAEEIPSVVATYGGDRIRVDYRENTGNAEVTSTVVEYGASSCEIPRTGN